MKLVLSCVSCLFAFSAAASPNLKVVSTLSDAALKKLKVHTVTVQDPNESTDQKPSKLSFKAYDGRQLLDLAFHGRAGWSKSKNINFECADGYRPSLETKEFLKGNVYFAFATGDGKEFSIINNLKDGKKAELAPYYVVWTAKPMQTKEKAHFWPYQVVSIGQE